jgi:drug/metabolite transporter (DMT)-like permease
MSTVPSATPSVAEPAGSDLPSRAKAWLTPAELLLLGAIWGVSFLFQRVAAKDFGSFALVEVRLLLGALVLMPFLWRGRRQFNLRLWLRLAGIGVSAHRAHQP